MKLKRKNFACFKHTLHSIDVPVGELSTVPPQPTKILYIKRVKQPTPMTELNELKALAQDLRNERPVHQEAAVARDVRGAAAAPSLDPSRDAPVT